MSKLQAIIFALFITSFGILSFLTNQYTSFTIDTIISQWLRKIDFPGFTSLMETASALGAIIPTIITVLGITLVLWFYGKRKEAFFIAALPSIAGLVNYLFKVLIARPRPNGGSLSFPSGHTIYAITLFGLLFYLLPRLIKQSALVLILRCLLGLIILLMGISRIYLEAHWPSDILGSILLGGFLLTLAITFYHDYKKDNKNESSEVANA
ncbi:MAG: phosphatase PAP2 family protein [Dehalococcoidales bacterium]|nr:phosphatase PAP2 family protein [Dehalococcoidales bacterium]